MPGLVLAKEDLKCSLAEPLAVVLSSEAFQQLYAYARAMEMESEISCLGSVARKDGIFHINRFYLVKQRGGFGSTELDQSAVAELMERLIKEGKQEEAKSIKCWCHTHGTMGAFWSETDNKTCRLLASDYLISLVVGGGFNVKCRLDTQSPIPMTIDGISVYYEPVLEKAELARYAEELKGHVIPEGVALRTYYEATKDEGNARAESRDQEDKDSFFREEDVEVYCEYCGCWHPEDRCPFLDDETGFYDEWEYGRFY